MAGSESSTLDAVTLRRIRYNDRHSILTVWSRQEGRVGLIISDQGSGRSASRLRALTMPVSMVECRATRRQGSDLMIASKFSMLNPLAGIHSSPTKGMVATFVAEAANTMLRQNAPDEGVWHFLTESLLTLDAATSSAVIAGFPVVFLFKLAEVLGVAPDVGDYAPGMLLDMTEGRFKPTATVDGRVLNSEDSRLIASLGKMTFDTVAEAQWGRADRNRVLDMMLGYISIHLSTPAELKSTAVLRSIFDTRPAASVLNNGAIGIHKSDTP